MKYMYELTKQIVRAKTQMVMAVREKHGQLLMIEEEILERWKEHFEECCSV